MPLTLPQLERHLFKAADILRGKMDVRMMVRAMSERLADEEAELRKLFDVKAGLMDDLLTGRVRVTPLLEAAAS